MRPLPAGNDATVTPHRDQRTTSKRLSFVLRHAPQSIGIQLDSAGWVDVDVLLEALAAHGLRLTRPELEVLVASSDKQRFAVSDDGRRIRANQGHSVPVELGHPVRRPPDVLFHGTPSRNVPSILREGLRPGRRHDVHLSPDVETAVRVGARRGQHVVLQVDAAAVHVSGTEFRLTPNGVWLAATVPPEHLRVLGP